MFIKTKLANKPIIYKDGYTNAALKSVTFIDASETEFDREQFQFFFTVIEAYQTGDDPEKTWCNLIS